jgi:hypothetical protein
LNAVENEEAISKLAELPFDPEGFPYALLEAFGNKATTIKRLKSGSTNSSDIDGGVLQRNNIHIAVCEKGQVTKTLAALKAKPSSASLVFVLFMTCLLSGSGWAEGTLFPWTVSDFSLIDAIECGIVKLPRVPVGKAACKNKTVRVIVFR